ncbi:MAG TPA: hypothetical protein VF941_03160 [Clostridia bacterium]
MAISLVNKAIGQSTPAGNSVPTSAGINVTAGNLLVVGARASANGATITPSDTAGNTFVSIGTLTDNTGLGDLQVWYVKNCLGNASDIFTATWNQTPSNRSIIALQYSGIDTTAPLDATPTIVNLTGTNSSATTGAFSTVNANELIVGFLAWDNGTAASVGLIGGATPTLEEDTASASTGLAAEDLIVSSIQTNITAAMGTNGSGDLIFLVASFKAAAASAHYFSSLPLVGVG